MTAWAHKLHIVSTSAHSLPPYVTNDRMWYVTCRDCGSFVRRTPDGYFGRPTWEAAFTLGMAHQIEQIVKEV